ncbi:MAG: rRNA methyltransferase [Lentisphaerae bacterium RIFOXYA12_FULL_48_11]|nr:MAG: rRNA methyltransferase [Lentisphaerae bacterium RIFOXYA12_FULL_48_11]
MPKERLDVLLTERGLVESREKAQRLIVAGKVKVKGHPATKCGNKFDVDVSIEVEARERFVSRGGEKLEGAFLSFDLNVNGLVCVDAGASTGGFTDCLLQHGAAKVYAIDVGKGQLHWNLRNDPRVVVMEETNARYLESRALPEKPAFAVIDVSFISLTKVMPAVINVLADGAGLVTLIKPQFEAGREQVEKGGVVRDPAVRTSVVEKVKEFGEKQLRLKCLGVCESPLKGPAGNVEFLAYWKKP